MRYAGGCIFYVILLYPGQLLSAIVALLRFQNSDCKLLCLTLTYTLCWN